MKENTVDPLKPKSSKTGKASLYLGILGWLSFFCMIVVSALSSMPLLALFMGLMVISAIASFITAIICFCQFNVKKTEPVLGLLLSGALLLVIALLSWIGQSGILRTM